MVAEATNSFDSDMALTEARLLGRDLEINHPKTMYHRYRTRVTTWILTPPGSRYLVWRRGDRNERKSRTRSASPRAVVNTGCQLLSFSSDESSRLRWVILGNFFCSSGGVLLHPLAEPDPTAFPRIGSLQSRDLSDSLCLTLEKISLLALPLGWCGSVSSKVLSVNIRAFYVLDDISIFSRRQAVPSPS
jgi:hypothetical protein